MSNHFERDHENLMSGIQYRGGIFTPNAPNKLKSRAQKKNNQDDYRPPDTEKRVLKQLRKFSTKTPQKSHPRAINDDGSVKSTQSLDIVPGPLATGHGSAIAINATSSTIMKHVGPKNGIHGIACNTCPLDSILMLFFCISYSGLCLSPFPDLDNEDSLPSLTFEMLAQNNCDGARMLWIQHFMKNKLSNRGFQRELDLHGAIGDFFHQGVHKWTKVTKCLTILDQLWRRQ